MENDITWNEFEEKLKELPEKALFRGQENSCWPVTTTLERLLDGREMSFQHYYKSILGYPFNRTHPGRQFSRGGSLEGAPGSAGARASGAAWATPPGAAWWR